MLLMLQNASATMSAIRDPDELRRYLLEQALDTVNAKTGSLMILDERGDLKIVEARGLDRKIVEQTRIRQGEGVSGSVASIGEPLLITDIEEDGRFQQRNRPRYDTRSLICVPLKIRDKTIGVINVNNKKSGALFDDDDLEFLTLLANQAAAATENADFTRKMETVLTEYEALRTAADTAVNGRSLTETIERLLDQAISSTGGSTCLLFLNDEAADKLYVASAAGKIADDLRDAEIPFGEGVLGEAARNGQEVMLNGGNRHEDSLGRFESLIAQPLFSANALLGFITVVEKKESDRFLAKDMSSLRGLANEIAAVLHISRVIFTQNAEAEEDGMTARQGANADKTNEFYLMAARELKKPLASVRKFNKQLLDRIGQGSYSLEARQYLEGIDGETAKMSAVIEDLLNLAQLESGQFTLDLRPVSLLDVVGKTLEEMSELSANKIETEMPETLSPAVVDKNRVSQILINLLKNAANYSHPGEPIKITIREHPDRFILAVIDKGIGIAPENHKKIFEKFFRADVPENKEVAGTGLGLAIVNRLVRLQGGEVGVESVPDHGSTFWFTLPKGILAGIESRKPATP